MAPGQPAIAGLNTFIMSAQRMQLADGRWHFQHGPMDIIMDARGRSEAVAAAHERAWLRFSGILAELVRELPELRRPVGHGCVLRGPVARRMWHACKPHSQSFITPMAAVAGAVAQELIACYRVHGVDRAWANNGGDIALHLAPSQSVRVGLFSDLSRLDVDALKGSRCQGLQTDGYFEVCSDDLVRGVATSGWRGRSFSLGIADSVTVLARSAADADAAATVIANAVNVSDARIARKAACDVKDDTDLGDLLVTVDVPQLEPALVQQALRSGLHRAQALQAAGLVWFAVLVCQRQIVTTSGAAQRSMKIPDKDNHSPKHAVRPLQLGSVFS